MQKTRSGRLFALGLGIVFLTGLFSPGAVTANWTTGGGDALRRSFNAEPVGLMQMEEAWRAELGQSATQPVVVGQTIYHLTKDYLWQIDLTTTGDMDGPPTPLGQPTPEFVNTWVDPVTGETVRLVSQSTPTYSPESGMLYFGNAFGQLWAYHTEQEWFRVERIQFGCPIVGSPLVLRHNNQDLVILATRPFFPDELAKSPPGRPDCDQAHGRVWRVTGLDKPAGTVSKLPYDAPASKDAAGGFGGFITPSAVPGPAPPEEPSFILGADGFAGGRAIRLVLDSTIGYAMLPKWTVDGPAGFAGSFASDGTYVYWLDTAGHLFGARLTDRARPATWPTQEINLAPLIGASAAFTNTAPAVEVRPDGTHLYITLRNWTYPGGPALRGGPTGTHGAVLAIGPDGNLKWHHNFDQPDAAGQATSINTNPLAITASNVMLFGDVNGFLYAYALDSVNAQGGHPQPFLAAQPGDAPAERMFLLGSGESPARGGFNFSQVSGVGVDPTMAAGLVLVGVNYDGNNQPGGRLVAYQVGRAYNLAWAGSPSPLALREGVEVILSHPVGFFSFIPTDLPKPSLGELCTATPDVQWYVTGPGGYIRKLWPEVDLPAGHPHGERRESAMAVTLVESYPAEGQIVAIIDHPGVMALAGAHPADPVVRLASEIGKAAGVKAKLTCQGAAEIVTEPGGAPLSGLADNVLVIPYAREQLIDDPWVMAIQAPERALTEGFTATVLLGYRSSTGATEAEVASRCWARPLPDGLPPGPAAYWGTTTIRKTAQGQAPSSAPCVFKGLTEGRWEVVAEIAYPGDTDPSNNRATAEVLVSDPQTTGEPGYGSALD